MSDTISFILQNKSGADQSAALFSLSGRKNSQLIFGDTYDKMAKIIYHKPLTIYGIRIIDQGEGLHERAIEIVKINASGNKTVNWINLLAFLRLEQIQADRIDIPISLILDVGTQINCTLRDEYLREFVFNLSGEHTIAEKDIQERRNWIPIVINTKNAKEKQRIQLFGRNFFSDTYLEDLMSKGINLNYMCETFDYTNGECDKLRVWNSVMCGSYKNRTIHLRRIYSRSANKLPDRINVTSITDDGAGKTSSYHMSTHITPMQMFDNVVDISKNKISFHIDTVENTYFEFYADKNNFLILFFEISKPNK